VTENKKAADKNKGKQIIFNYFQLL